MDRLWDDISERLQAFRHTRTQTEDFGFVTWAARKAGLFADRGQCSEHWLESV